MQNNKPLIFSILAAAVLISGSMVFLARQLGSQNAAADLQPAIEKGIENFIKKQQAAAQPPAAEAAGPVKPVSSEDHVFGDKNAEISLIEYSDFECPFCKRFHPTARQVADTYKGKVNWVYRHFPLSFHANAQKEAEASECANELGGNDKFWEYTDKIFERTTSNGTGFALEALVPLAKEIGLGEGEFKECLDSGRYAEHVQQNMTEGQAAGISGTPGNIIYNNKTKASKSLPGAQPFSVFEEAIETELKQ